MKHDTAGDPMTGVKWTRRTTDKIACELRSLGVNVSSKTVGRLLKQLGFSLRVNHKKLCGATSEDRDTQFACIAELRERFAAAGHPIISVDTKKRELVGLFKNGGQAWNRKPTLVKDHDFRSESNGIAILCLLFIHPCASNLISLRSVLPSSSVGEMTLRRYGALSYSQNSARDLRCALNGA